MRTLNKGVRNTSADAGVNTARMQMYNKRSGAGGIEIGESTPLNENSTPTVIDDFKKVLSETIADVLWNRLVYVADFSPFTVTTTSAAEVFQRFRDTSAGTFLTVTKPSKMRCLFYYGTSAAATTATSYITTAHVRTSTSAPITTAEASAGSMFVGIKIDLGTVYLVSYDPVTSTETLIPTGREIIDTTTNYLEVEFAPGQNATVYLNKEYIGSIGTNLPKDSDALQIYYPLFVGLKRNGGTNYTLNFDYFEFLQER